MAFDLEYADSIKDLSVFHNIGEEFTLTDFGDEELFVNDQRGFSIILQEMAKDLDIRFNQTVQRIQYDENGVTIKTNEDEFKA